MDQVVNQIALQFPEFSRWFAAGMVVFARLLGFVRFAPIFNRKEIAGLVNYLISDEAKGLTAQNISLCAGLSAG